MKTKITVCIAVFGAALLGEQVEVGAGQVPDNMVWIPPGTFMMGSPANEQGRNRDEIQHRVTISRGFYMARHETTQEEYSAVMGNDQSSFTGNLRLPVETKMWEETVEYCKVLTALEQRTGRLPIGYIYRLPTEAEWEYACRAGTTTATAFGDSLSSTQANFNGSEPYNGAPIGPYLGKTSVAESYAPNAWRLYDMHGNVWEYCLDWYGSYPTGDVTDPHVTDPQGPFSSPRVIRGGSWRDGGAFICRSANRGNTIQGRRDNGIGFRPVLAWNSVSFSSWATDVFGNVPKVVQPTYSEPPKKEVAKDSLVVVTHGWIQKELHPISPPEDVPWVKETTNAISQYIGAKGLQNWQVEGYLWTAKAWVAIFEGGARKALDNAKLEGENLGKTLVKDKRAFIHLIAHSAGAGLIQAASETIKRESPDTIVHLTFLDPFVGFDDADRASYGKGANWSDSYFSRDVLTSPVIYQFTEGPLDNAYNVDVTLLDPNKSLVNVYSSSQNGKIEYCYQTKTSHEWPHEFYLRTIPPNKIDNAGDFGFPLSEESGGFSKAVAKYGKRGNVPGTLGTPDPPCGENIYVTTPSFLGPKMEFKETSVIKSPTGTIKLDSFSVTLVTGSPVWVASNLVITNRVNFVSFESRFLSGNGSEGLLSVYSGTNLLGMIDERVAPAGIRTNTFVLPGTITQGRVVLGFRLDAFSGTSSSITITNVSLGFAGLNQPFSLSATGLYENGKPVLQLAGPARYNYSVETSTNLTEWTPIALLVNTNGTVRFVDPSTNNMASRFYRAVTP